MSNARSPRFDCSTTMGTSVLLKSATGSLIVSLLQFGRADARPCISASSETLKGALLALAGFLSALVLVAEEDVLGDGLLVDLNLGQDLVDDLLLEQRCPDFSEGLRVLLVELPNLTLLAGILADPLDEGLSHLIVGNLDIGLLTDLRKDQTETHATLGDLAVLSLGLVLGGALVLEGAVVRLHVADDLRPHGRELLLDEGRRQLEAVLGVEGVQKLLLHLAAGLGVEIALDGIADRVLELVQGLHAEALGHLVVDLQLARSLDFLHGHVELGILAGEMRRQVVLG